MVPVFGRGLAAGASFQLSWSVDDSSDAFRRSAISLPDRGDTEYLGSGQTVSEESAVTNTFSTFRIGSHWPSDRPATAQCPVSGGCGGCGQ